MDWMRISEWQRTIVDKAFANPVPTLDEALARLDTSRAAVEMYARARSTPPPADPQLLALQGAVHIAETGHWDDSTDTALGLVELASFHQQFPDVRALQRAVGTTPDGQWGPQSKAALVATTKLIQTALKVDSDGEWGPQTEAAYQALRSSLRPLAPSR